MTLHAKNPIAFAEKKNRKQIIGTLLIIATLFLMAGNVFGTVGFKIKNANANFEQITVF